MADLLHSFRILNMRAILLCLFLCLFPTAVIAQGELKQQLNEMALYFGDGQWPEDYYDNLVACFDKWDEPFQPEAMVRATGEVSLLKAQDAAWSLFHKVYNNDSLTSESDWNTPAKQEPQAPSNEPEKIRPILINNRNLWLEGEANRADFFGSEENGRVYKIWEPCNYVSNAAYYTLAMRVCEYDDKWNMNEDLQAAMVKSFASIGLASAWFHGMPSPTSGVWDGYSNDLAVFNAYQVMIQHVESNSLLFRTMSNKATAPLDPVKLTNDFAFLSLNPTVELLEYISEIKGQTLGRSALNINLNIILPPMFAFATATMFPFSFVESIIQNQVAPIFLDNETLAFFRDEYMPELRRVARQENFPVPLWQRAPLIRQWSGVAAGFIYALLFQERTFDLPYREGPVINSTALGAFLARPYDWLLGLMSGIPSGAYDESTYDGDAEYPGGEKCNRISPHALWHQVSADSLFDMLVAADTTSQILLEYKNKDQPSFPGVIQSWVGRMAKGVTNFLGNEPRGA